MECETTSENNGCNYKCCNSWITWPTTLSQRKTRLFRAGRTTTAATTWRGPDAGPAGSAQYVPEKLPAVIPDATQQHQAGDVPLSRYFTTAYCNVPEQLANKGEENFSSVVLGGLERLRMSTIDFLCTNRIRNLKMASPFVAHGQAQNDGQGPAGEKINEFWISGSPPPVRSRVYSALLAAILKAAA